MNITSLAPNHQEEKYTLRNSYFLLAKLSSCCIARNDPSLRTPIAPRWSALYVQIYPSIDPNTCSQRPHSNLIPITSRTSRPLLSPILPSLMSPSFPPCLPTSQLKDVHVLAASAGLFPYPPSRLAGAFFLGARVLAGCCFIGGLKGVAFAPDDELPCPSRAFAWLENGGQGLENGELRLQEQEKFPQVGQSILVVVSWFWLW